MYPQTGNTNMKKNDRILLVCDDDAARGMYLESLATSFRHIEFVADGDEALQAMEQGPFDLVLLDLHPPGTAILRSIKQVSPDSEVVVITAQPNLAGAKEAVRLGAYDYLGKPIGRDRMISVSSAALTHKGWALHAEHRA